MNTQRTPFVGSNWKMNTNAQEGFALIDAIGGLMQDGGVDVAVFPPFPYLMGIGERIKGGILLGAQDIWHNGNGAFTGEVSAEMLNDCGVNTVLTGHSERRHVIGESDELVNLKTKRVLESGLTAVLCIGELLEEREAGETDAVNERQIRAGLAGISEEQLGKVVLAYEPVWAIGTGKTATPEDAQNAHAAIRALICGMYSPAAGGAMRIIYGGSMKPSNAGELMAMTDVDGGLIGGASLKADDFYGIIEAARGSLVG
ncbi:MAG: triose-phosphate isomerase [Phycisphaerales bacterium]|nr:triose-phosphate isomerase [Phycisphaerales bacterium]